jgi:hypothetical protein
MKGVHSMGKRKNKVNRRRFLILISAIFSLNAVGLSYAYWSGQVDIITTLTTGDIDPVFCPDNYKIDIVPDGDPKQLNGNNCGNGIGNLPQVSNLKVEFQDENHTMFITGQLEEGYKAFINYCIANKGTIPIKYDNQVQCKENVPEDCSQGMQNGIKLEVDQASNIIMPQDEIFSKQGNGNPKLQIQAINGQGTNERSFEIKLPFVQWNKK